MALTYEPIATTTLGSTAASITFSSISSSYTDLRVVAFLRCDYAATATSMVFTVNNDTAGNYSFTRLVGDGSTASSASFTSSSGIDRWQIPGSSAAANIYGFLTLDLFSYSGSTYKTILESNSIDRNGTGTTEIGVGLWRSTSAINSIKFDVTALSATFNVGSSVTLYGIKAA